MEAFRRKHFLKPDDAEPKFLGLGTAAQYRSSLFTPSFTENKTRGILNWYQLTDKGQELMSKLEKKFDTKNDINSVNNMLFNLK
jgi:hypothetical protein